MPTSHLPVLGDPQVPGSRLVRHAVSTTIAVVAFATILTVVGAAFVSMNVSVEGVGVLEPLSVWPIRSMEGGIVESILVHTGEVVQRGQPIARLDSLAAWGASAEIDAQLLIARLELERLEQSIPIQLQLADAGILSAEARLARARTALRQKMADFSVVGDPDSIARAASGRVHVGLDAPSADLLVAYGDLAASRAQRLTAEGSAVAIVRQRAEIRRTTVQSGTAKARLQRGIVRAPADGIVLTDQPEQLNGSQTIAGQTLLEIGDIHHWRVSLAVAERDIHRIQAGDAADIELPAFTDAANRIRGRVESIGWQPASFVEGGAAGVARGGYRVLVVLDSTAMHSTLARGFRRGYAAHAKIVTRSDRALTVVMEYFRDRARGLTR
ncbi:MAG: efflux transporter, family, subunit [Gemmatimonadetes bacterium]|nr:efflux transporter, family, subunit [Gemmatimonadota bacterium]